MKFLSKFVILLTLVLAACNLNVPVSDEHNPSNPAAPATLENTFPDANLRALIALRLGESANLSGQSLLEALAAINEVLEIWKGDADALDPDYTMFHTLDENNNWVETRITGIVPHNMSGIEHLTGLTGLLLGGIDITTLNLSNLTNLTEIVLSRTQLTGLNVSNLPNLFTLEIHNNSQLTHLTVNNLIQLNIFSVQNNPFTGLDINNTPNLAYLTINSSPLLTTLDVSHLTTLFSLNVNNNPILTTLNAGNLTNLAHFMVSHNPILATLDVRNTNFPRLILLGNTALTKLYAHNSGLVNETHINNMPAGLVIDWTTPR
ncbi:MAG: hypothetical protein FWE37_02305 [Spirochaetaceae bacterium]|nr:hypothetical protein [Spirochaetaceae bacterium]